MKTLLDTLRRRCLAKPGVQKGIDGEEYTVLDGFLDGFVQLIVEETPPVLLLRCRDALRKQLAKTSSAIRVSERMQWETQGWDWTDVILDGTISEEALLALIDDSYQLVYDSLEEDQKHRIALLTQDLKPPELLANLIEFGGLSRRRQEIEKLAKPALLLRTRRAAESRLPLGQTKIGGRPDLPQGSAWPTYRDGRPLAFLAQINLAELPEAGKLRSLPTRGLLSFFSVFGWQVDGDADPQLPPGDYDYDWTQVVYQPDDPASLERRPTPANVNAFKAAKVEFVPIVSLPTHTRELVVAKLHWKRDVKDKYEDLVHSFKSAWSYPLGNPAPHLWGGFADYEQDFVDVVARQDLRLLFQLASDDNTGMCWGDGGYVYFWIRPEDRQRRNFKRIYTDYQCG
jgi:uncharacterized protein YwqG/predicted DNA-binding protein (MmcQ/YjbR family)